MVVGVLVELLLAWLLAAAAEDADVTEAVSGAEVAAGGEVFLLLLTLLVFGEGFSVPGLQAKAIKH